MTKSHYFKTKVTKMGKWSLAPNDSETWHGEYTNQYFQKHFNFPKGILALHTLKDGYQHVYIPTQYFNDLFKHIQKIKKKDYRGLEKKLKVFYKLVKKARTQVDKARGINLQKLSNRQLGALYNHNRRWVQEVTIFDQLGWILEEQWMPLMREVLEKKLDLIFGSEQYNKALFTLTKPENISSTLREKREVLKQTILFKKGKTNLKRAAQKLAKLFGWMPVFTYGNAWTEEHYKPEIEQMSQRGITELQNEYHLLANYSKTVVSDVINITKKYGLDKKDLQIFIDFGLMLDTRNEAEYFVGYAGYYLVPIIAEVAKRLYLSTKQVRLMTQREIIKCLLGKQNPHTVINNKGRIVGWGFDIKMKKRIDFSTIEAEQIYNYIESYAKPVQGGDESKGTCASPGIAKGKIRIVPSPEQNYKVKDGDVLVTYATTTDYLPAMKRAAAIITEVGGLTCHAAVVSREFGIPCIIALTNAMKNFKDGDMVEVDANKGIVRKIK